MPFLEVAAIAKALESVGTSLAGKAPSAAYGKWSSARQTRIDLRIAWNDARDKTIAANSGFGALVDEKELQKVVLEHALNPYMLDHPDLAKLHDAASVRHIGTKQANEATERFLEYFRQSWVAKKSFRPLAELFEQLRANDQIGELRSAIERAFDTISQTGLPTRAAAIPAPSDSLLLEYCERVTRDLRDEFLLKRSVHAEFASMAKHSPADIAPFETALAEHEHLVLLGEGGLGKTKALRSRERELAADFCAGNGSYIPVYLKLSEYQGGSIEQLVASRVNEVLTGSGQRLGETNDESERAVRTWFQEEEHMIEVLLDGVNEVEGGAAARFRTNLEAFLRYKQRFVFTSREHETGLLAERPIKTFRLLPLTAEDIKELLARKLQEKSGEFYSRLMSDTALAELSGNPFMLGLFSAFAEMSPDSSLPENRAWLMRAFARLVFRVVPRERTVKAVKAGVLPLFLKALGWEMLRNGVVSADYATTYAWGLPTSGLTLDDLLSGASAFRFLLSPADNGERIEFVHPLFRDYFAAERICSRLEAGDDLGQATEGEGGLPDWREALQMTAGLCEKKAGQIVVWLANKESFVTAFDCWEGSKARDDKLATQELAKALRRGLEQYLNRGSFAAVAFVTRLGKLRDLNAVPLIERYLAESRSGHWAAIAALEEIRSDESIRALVKALDSKEWDAKRHAKEALLRIGVEAVPALLRSPNTTAEWILHQVGPQAIATLTESLSDTDVGARARAVRALGSAEREETAQILVPLLKTGDAWVRAETAFALGRIGNPIAAEPLVEALGDENLEVRLYAGFALWKRAWAPDAARGALFEMYRASATYAASKADILECLMIRPDEQIAHLVIEAAGNQYDDVRAKAFDLLTNLPSAPQELLAAGLRDQVISVQRTAAGLLIGAVGTLALPKLVEAFEEDPRNRYSLLEAIGRNLGEPGRDCLIRLLQSGLDQGARATAVVQLARFEDQPAASALIAALEAADPKQELNLTWELIEALQNSDDPAVSRRLRTIATDETTNDYLRDLATKALERIRKRAAAQP